MNQVREHELPTPGLVELAIELGAGSVVVRATEAATQAGVTRITVEGEHADRVRVDAAGTRLSIIGPRLRPLMAGEAGRIALDVTVPVGSVVAARAGSAELDLRGELGALRLRTGSGAVGVELATGPAVIETGSGSIRVGEAHAELRVKSGSGEVVVDTADADVAVSTGSGDVTLGTMSATARVKTGSGSLRVARASGDVALSTASGDLEVGSAGRGRISGKGASGDITVTVPAGVPVWTDVSTVSGRIRSSLRGAGQPAPDQDHVEVRARTMSGNISLVEA